MMPTERPRKLARRLAIAGLSFVAVFALLEVGVRAYAALFLPGRGFFREERLTSPWFLTYEPPSPRLDERGDAWFHHGRGPVAVEKPAGVRRLLAVGGSTTVNRRAVQLGGRDYATHLEALLDQAEPEVPHEVLNCGGDAYSSAHSLVNLQLRLLELEPDVVLLMHAVNDLTVNYYGGRASADYGNKYLRSFYVNPSLQAGRSLEGFLYQSRLLAAIGVVGMFEHGERRIDVDVAPGLEYFRRNLRLIGAACAQRGAALVLLSQPCRLQDTRSYDPEHLARYNAAVAEVAAELGCRFIDMHARFGHDPADFVDEFHYSPAGVERFARLLAAEL